MSSARFDDESETVVIEYRYIFYFPLHALESRLFFLAGRGDKLFLQVRPEYPLGLRARRHAN